MKKSFLLQHFKGANVIGDMTYSCKKDELKKENSSLYNLKRENSAYYSACLQMKDSALYTLEKLKRQKEVLQKEYEEYGYIHPSTLQVAKLIFNNYASFCGLMASQYSQMFTSQESLAHNYNILRRYVHCLEYVKSKDEMNEDTFACIEVGKSFYDLYIVEHTFQEKKPHELVARIGQKIVGLGLYYLESSLKKDVDNGRWYDHEKLDNFHTWRKYGYTLFNKIKFSKKYSSRLAKLLKDGVTNGMQDASQVAEVAKKKKESQRVNEYNIAYEIKLDPKAFDKSLNKVIQEKVKQYMYRYVK